MAAIYLIRHGQASFGKADYDKLSAKGCKQSEILGQHLGTIVNSDRFYAGDLLRHGQTLSHFNKGAKSNDASMITHSGFNEFDHLEILARHDARWSDPAAMGKEISKVPDGNKVFQQEFSNALNRWIESDKDKSCTDYKESWSQFKARCVNALQDVIQQYLSVRGDQTTTSGSKDVLIFTSGGPISIIIQHVLGLTDAQTLLINQQLVNTSVTKLLFSKSKLSLDYYNNYSHLELKGSQWPTFR